MLGRILNELTERVTAEPALNDRAILLELARGLVDGSADGESAVDSSDHLNEAP
jgi:hypothetical protein